MRYFFTCQFRGTHFSGSQIQVDTRTVQGELEKALAIYFRKSSMRVTLSSRVDSGVHARGMTGHFDLEGADAFLLKRLPMRELLGHLNGILPKDLSILRCWPVSQDQHARYSAISRTYIYRLRMMTERRPLDYDHVAYYPYDIQLADMQRVVESLYGTLNCDGLARDYKYHTSPLCQISGAKWFIDDKDKELWLFQITANHYLYKMVRNIVGLSIDVARGHLPADTMQRILDTQDRSLLGHTAKAEGLTLEKVSYENDT